MTTANLGQCLIDTGHILTCRMTKVMINDINHTIISCNFWNPSSRLAFGFARDTFRAFATLPSNNCPQTKRSVVAYLWSDFRNMFPSFRMFNSNLRSLSSCNRKTSCLSSSPSLSSNLTASDEVLFAQMDSASFDTADTSSRTPSSFPLSRTPSSFPSSISTSSSRIKPG